MTAEVCVIEQEPVPPAVVAAAGDGAPLIVKLIVVPSGAFWKPPVPVFTLT